MFNALFIADVGKNVLKDRHHAALCRRNVQTGLGHQAKQSQCFQNHGFTAGIRPGDNQRIVVLAQGDRGGNNLFAVNQRVPPLADFDGIILAEVGADRLHIDGKSCLGEDKVQMNQSVKIQRQNFGSFGCQKGKLCQNTFNFRLFADFQLVQLVVCVDNALRLDKYRAAGRRNVMDNTAHVAAVLCFDRNHVAVIAHGDNGIL